MSLFLQNGLAQLLLLHSFYAAHFDMLGDWGQLGRRDSQCSCTELLSKVRLWPCGVMLHEVKERSRFYSWLFGDRLVHLPFVWARLLV